MKSSPEFKNSRYVTVEDERASNVIYDLPMVWWSRPYEYAFALKFANPKERVLDAATGVCHPLKFALVERECDVYACDIDERVMSEQGIVSDLLNEKVDPKLVLPYIPKIKMSMADLTKLPYNDGFFDVVFCISVLEHLGQSTPECSTLIEKVSRRFQMLLSTISQKSELAHALLEMERVLKPGGKLVLTFDIPNVSIQEFMKLVEQTTKLRPIGSVDFKRPNNALHSAAHLTQREVLWSQDLRFDSL
jgi:SAM-dependent methyltransferase